MSQVLWIVLACALANYLIRSVPFFMKDWNGVPRSLRRFLTIMPTAALGALIIPGSFESLSSTGRPWAALGGLIAAALAAHKSKNLIIPVAAAVLVTWALLQFP